MEHTNRAEPGRDLVPEQAHLTVTSHSVLFTNLNAVIQIILMMSATTLGIIAINKNMDLLIVEVYVENKGEL